MCLKFSFVGSTWCPGRRQLSTTGSPASLASSDRQQVPTSGELRQRVRVQEEVDDLIHDEAEEVADAEDALRTHRQVDLRERRDMTNEEVERYIKERFEEPALREAQLRDDGAQAGAWHRCSCNSCILLYKHCIDKVATTLSPHIVWS